MLITRKPAQSLLRYVYFILFFVFSFSFFNTLPGTKRVVDAFLPFLQGQGRVVNVGSGAGPMYVSRQIKAQNKADVALLTSWDTSYDDLNAYVQKTLDSYDKKEDAYNAYGLSKAALTTYTMGLAKKFHEAPNTSTLAACLTPGFIDTAIVKGFGAKKPASEGTKSIHHCLFSDNVGNGFYYGSDGVRSPLTVLRNPGEPEYKPADDKYQHSKKE